VEQVPAEGGLQDVRLARLVVLGRLPVHRRHRVALDPQFDLRLQVEFAEVVGHDGLADVAERPAFSLRTLLHGGQVVQADDHVLGGHGDRLAVGGLEDVVRGEHQDARLGLGLRRQRQVDRHLVAVEVRVERGADERVDLDGLALDQLRFERLDAQAVQGRRPVEQDGVLGDDFLQHVPHHGPGPLHHAFGALDVLRMVQVDQALHHERLEQLQRHLLGQAALVQLELRADHDDRAARVVDALTQQVLAEPSLLALEHVGQGLERTVARTGDGAAAAAVVEQRVNGLLEHALLVVDDDLGRAEVEKPLEPVVAVDDPTVQVVQVGGGEAATVELNHGTQVRRDHRDAVQHHAHRAVAGVEERRDDLEPLEGAGLLLALARADDLAELLGFGLQVEVGQPLLDRLGAHTAAEVLAEAVPHFAVELLIAFEVLDLEVLEAVPDLFEAVDLPLGAVADLPDLPLGGLAHLAAGIRLGALFLQFGQVGFELAVALLDRGVAALLEVLPLDGDLGFQGRQVALAGLGVHPGDHVGREVDDLLQVLGCEVEEVAQAAGHALEVPDVGDGSGQLDVAHAFPPHLGPRDLDTAAFANDALEADPLVLTAVALPVPGRT